MAAAGGSASPPNDRLELRLNGSCKWLYKLSEGRMASLLVPAPMLLNARNVPGSRLYVGGGTASVRDDVAGCKLPSKPTSGDADGLKPSTLRRACPKLLTTGASPRCRGGCSNRTGDSVEETGKRRDDAADGGLTVAAAGAAAVGATDAG